MDLLERTNLPVVLYQYEELLMSAVNRVVKQALSLKHDVEASMWAKELYPPEIQRAAAWSGYTAHFSIYQTLTFLIVIQSSSQRKKAGFWSRIFSTKAGNLHRAHGKMLDIFQGHGAKYWDQNLVPVFIDGMHGGFIHQAKEVAEARLEDEL